MNFLQFLGEALKSRISRDMGPERFPGAGWDQIALGTYYFSTDTQTSLIVIHRVVGQVLQHSLAAFGMMILKDSWRRFFEGISATTMAAVALERFKWELDLPMSRPFAGTVHGMFASYERGNQPPFASADVKACTIGYRIRSAGWGITR